MGGIVPIGPLTRGEGGTRPAGLEHGAAGRRTAGRRAEARALVVPKGRIAASLLFRMRAGGCEGGVLETHKAFI